MSVLILKNVTNEGPGTIEDYLRDNDINYRVVELANGDDIPPTEDVDALVILGGHMSVNEAHLFPYISQEEDLVRRFLHMDKKIFGICLGAQIIAKALGARVYPGPEKEIGWYDIELQENGIKDKRIGRLALHPRAGDFWTRFKVFHWHGETFDLPAGAERIAGSALYQNQAFKYGHNAYAFQFHIEVRKETIYEWLKNEPVDMNKVRNETEAYYDDYFGRAMNFYKAFFEK